MTTLTYDLDERVSQIASAYGGTAGPQVAFNYDPASRMTSAAATIGGTGNSVNTSYSYDAAGRQTTITHQAVTTTSGGGGTTTTPLATYVYSYDNADRVTSEKDAEGTASFTYDSANELTTVTGSRSESYTYDLNGNRTGTGYSTTVMNETATSPGTTYTYDNAGNMISANNGSSITTYTYDYRNRLTDVTQGGTIIASYTYDALNRRIGIDDNSSQTWTVYDGTNPYADFNGSGTLQERYLFGPGVVTGAVVDELLARTSSGGTTAWYLPDQLGSVRDIVSTAGTELDHVVYDSFGNILTETNAANGDRFKFAGMEYDSATLQYYDRARGYDSSIGRFTGLDPTGFSAGDPDLYDYVRNGPTDQTDPTGLQAQQSRQQGQTNGRSDGDLTVPNLGPPAQQGPPQQDANGSQSKALAPLDPAKLINLQKEDLLTIQAGYAEQLKAIQTERNALVTQQKEQVAKWAVQIKKVIEISFTNLAKARQQFQATVLKDDEARAALEDALNIIRLNRDAQFMLGQLKLIRDRIAQQTIEDADAKAKLKAKQEAEANDATKSKPAN